MPSVYVIVETPNTTDVTVQGMPGTNLRTWKVEAEDTTDLKPLVRDILSKHQNQIGAKAIVMLEDQAKVFEMRGSLSEVA